MLPFRRETAVRSLTLQSRTMATSLPTTQGFLNRTVMDTIVELTPEEQQVANLFYVATRINDLYLWAIFALGFPGNCAAIVTIVRMRSIGTFPICVALLAVVDTMALSVKLLFFQLLRRQVDVGSSGCNILSFLGSFTTSYSSWILVFMALERYVAVRFPLKITNGSGARKTAIVLAIVGLVIALIFIPTLWVYDIADIDGILQCRVKPRYLYFMTNIFYWISTTVYGLLPIFLLSIFNCLIAHQIRTSFKARKVMRNLQMEPLNSSCEVPLHRQVNLMLLSATVVFVVLTLPISVYFVAEVHWEVEKHDSRSQAVRFLIQQISFVLCDSTHAVNFYLYFLTAKRFRHHFLRLVTCKGCSCRRTNCPSSLSCTSGCCCCRCCSSKVESEDL